MARIITMSSGAVVHIRGNYIFTLKSQRSDDRLRAIIRVMDATVTAVTSPAKHTELLNAFFLPDLCNTRAVLILLVVSEALVLAMTLIESSLTHFSWQRFTVVSFFVQWVCLLSVAILCQLRETLVKVRAFTAAIWSLVVIALVTLTVSIIGELLWPVAGGIDWSWAARNVVIGLIFGAMAMRYFYVQSQWRLKTQAELKARLSALQANIRPHFFFNTLNTVASLIVVDPDKAERLLLDLAQLFRVVLNNDDSLIALNDEITFGRQYLSIEQVRLGEERLRIEWDLPTPMPAIQVPQLLLQPLLENAVYHGIQPSVEGGYIRISLKQEQQLWRLSIANSLVHGARGTGHQLAHKNIHARLAVLGRSARLQLEQNEAEYVAHLWLPEMESTT